MALQFEVTDAPEAENLPKDTLIPARLEGLHRRTIEYADKQTGEAKTFDVLDWMFRTSDAYGSRRVKGGTPASITNATGNRFRAWVEALIGQEIAPGFTFTDDDIVGLPCLITIAHTQDRKDPRKYWDNVEDVLAASESDEPPF
jgi:hypothetical protein